MLDDYFKGVGPSDYQHVIIKKWLEMDRTFLFIVVLLSGYQVPE